MLTLCSTRLKRSGHARTASDNLGFIQRPGTNFVSGSTAPIHKPASTRPGDADILSWGYAYFHPLWVRRSLMFNSVVNTPG
jgi:hypothetical protein